MIEQAPNERNRRPETTASGHTGAVVSVVCFAVLALGSSCSDAPADLEPTRTYEAGQAVCPDGPPAPAATVYANVQSIGSAANAIAGGDGHLWVVESTENTVSRYAPLADDYDPYFIDVHNGRNPWDTTVDEDQGLVYVTNREAGTLSVASIETGDIVEEIGAEENNADEPVFDDPQGLGMSAERIYVTNTVHRGPGDYRQGFVTVLDRQTREVLGRVDTDHPNPSYVREVDTPRGPAMLVVNTGSLEVTNDGAFVRGESSVELWRETDDAIEPEREAFVLENTDDPRMGAPGKPVMSPDGRYVYLPSITAPVVFKFDLHERRWARGTDDPIVLYDSDGDTTHSATMDERGVLYVTALNQDAMYLLDTRCDRVLAGPIDLGVTDTYLEAPQDVRIVETDEGPRAYFIMTLSNALGRVDLRF